MERTEEEMRVGREKWIKWRKENPGKGFRDYLLSMGPFKDVPMGDEE